MRRCLPLLSLLVALTLPPAADAHGPAPKGMGERALRAWERDLLGDRHAADHALRRELARRPGARARVERERRRARAAVDGPADRIGRWTSRFDIPVMGINAAMLPTGKVLWYAYPNQPDSATPKDEAWAVLWDPTQGEGAGAFKRVDPVDPQTNRKPNIWCSGTSFLADGRVLVTGGTAAYYTAQNPRWKGLDQVWTFNPWSERWTRQPDMERGRWYPTQLLMPDGRSLIVQGEGEAEDRSKNTDVEVFTPPADLDGVGRVDRIGRLPVVGDYYPHMFWMPSGRALLAGPFRNDSWYLNGPGATPTSTVAWTDVADLRRRRVWGTAVLEPGSPTKVLQIGGSDTGPDYDNAPATDTTESFDERNPGAGWNFDSPLNIGRGHHNTVLLPDGSMVTVGGGIGSGGPQRLWSGTADHRQVELWHPGTKTWTYGPAQLETRAYHSTALLLPDGRVVSAGDDMNGGFDRDSAEIYEPPYLHKGQRPVIDAAPTAVEWGANFDVATPDDDIARATLIAPGAATHALDMNQRYVPLGVEGRSTGRVTLKAPASPNLAPGGYYMLFLVDGRGVPSKASWVRLRGGGIEGAVAPVPAPEPVAAAPEPEPDPAVAAPSPSAAQPAPTPANATPSPASGTPTAPGTAHPEALTVAPGVHARLVRRGRRRAIRVVVPRQTRRTVRIRIVLRDRRGRALVAATRRVRTGRTTILFRPRVPAAARTVPVRTL